MFWNLIIVEEIEFFLIKKTDWLQSKLFLDYTSPRLVQN